MISTLTRTFLRGLFAGLPVILSVYVLVWFFNLLDRMSKGLFTWILPSLKDVPGVGILVGVGILFVLGFLLNLPLLATLFTYIELPFRNVPMLKSVYSALKDLLDYFGKDSNSNSQVVVVQSPEGGPQMMGLLTRPNLQDLPPEVEDRDGTVAVFFPMSYALGGYTAFVPKTWIRPTQMKVEMVMRSALTAWIRK
ncbi:MAG TPA: DUF502 domain-containing protein [Bdellovibrionota bacterium]|jgi:uncharacterized membrane protein|nr:DUF502 domain-containing protein [Bdellovibrionota bacterium]